MIIFNNNMSSLKISTRGDEYMMIITMYFNFGIYQDTTLLEFYLIITATNPNLRWNNNSIAFNSITPPQ